jgi:hypothetical protein
MLAAMVRVIVAVMDSGVVAVCGSDDGSVKVIATGGDAGRW